MSVKHELERHLLSELLVEHDKKSLDPDEDMLTQGLIDSIGILHLVSFMERQFGIKVADEEIIPENFRTLNCLADYVQTKTAKQG